MDSCCCTLTFLILHFKVYDILNCKNFLIGFLDELGNFKQKIFTFQNVIFFLHFTATGRARSVDLSIPCKKHFFQKDSKLVSIFMQSSTYEFQKQPTSSSISIKSCYSQWVYDSISEW